MPLCFSSSPPHSPHRCISGQLGDISAGPDGSRGVDGGRVQFPHQHLGDKGGAASLGCLKGLDHGGACGLDEGQCHDSGIHQETGVTVHM